MAATFGSAAFGDLAGSGTTVTVNQPSGTVEKSLLIARITNALGGVTWSAPADAVPWVGPVATASRSAIFYKIAGASEPASYTFTRTLGAGTNIHGVIERWENSDLVTPLADTQGVDSVSTANASSPTATASQADSVLACALTNCATNTSSVTVPAGMSQTYQTNTTATKAGASLTVGSGATGAKQWTNPLATNYMTSVVINPKPAPETGTFTGSYDFSGSAFAGAAGPGAGDFAGAYDFTGSAFVGVAGAPSSFGFFNGGFDFSAVTFTGVAPVEPAGGNLTPGGRDRFTARRTPKNRRRSR